MKYRRKRMMPKNKNPKISVCIPVYNHEKYIAQCIESVISQDYQNIEVIISDNCSTDGTADIIKRYLSDTRVRFYHNETNLGMVRNTEILLNYIKGDFAAILSSDDYWSDLTFLSQAVDRINAHEDVIMVCGGKKYFLEDDKTQIQDFSDNTDDIYDGRQIVLRGLNAWVSFELGSMVIKTTFVKRIFDFRYDLPGNDVLYFWKLCLQGKVYVLRKPFLMFRVHHNNTGRCYSIDDFIKRIICNSIVPILLYNDVIKNNYFLKSVLDKWLIKNVLLFMIGPWGWDNFDIFKKAYEDILVKTGFSISDFGIESLFNRLHKIKNLEEKTYDLSDYITADDLEEPDNKIISMISDHIQENCQERINDYEYILNNSHTLKKKVCDYIKGDMELIGSINYDIRIKNSLLESGIEGDKVRDFFDIFVYSKTYINIPAKLQTVNFNFMQGGLGSFEQINGHAGQEFNIIDNIVDIFGSGWIIDAVNKTVPDSVYVGLSQNDQIKYFIETKLYKGHDIANIIGSNPLGNYSYYFVIPSDIILSGKYNIITIFIKKNNAFIFDNNKKLIC